MSVRNVAVVDSFFTNVSDVEKVNKIHMQVFPKEIPQTFLASLDFIVLYSIMICISSFMVNRDVTNWCL